MSAATRFVQGAAVRTADRRSAQPIPVASDQPPARPMNGEARAFAEANRHKSWARRWLKANGCVV